METESVTYVRANMAPSYDHTATRLIPGLEAGSRIKARKHV